MKETSFSPVKPTFSTAKPILILVAIFTVLTATAQPQLTPLCLPYPGRKPGQMHAMRACMTLEGRTLYVSTHNGVYSIDLDRTADGWTLKGFEGEDILQFAHVGDEWLAITRNQGQRLLLRSTDGGATFDDFTPEAFLVDKKYTNIDRLVQHPADPRTILAGSGYFGIMRSEDFGQTWTTLTDIWLKNATTSSLEIHPLDPNIIVQHAEDGSLTGTINITYDGGKTWRYGNLPSSVFGGDNCVHDFAFHPTDINTWVFGGEGIMCKTTDKGNSWTTKINEWSTGKVGYMFTTLYDNRNPDIIYSLGGVAGTLCLLLSTDGGETWNRVYQETKYDYYNPNQLLQDDDNLILFCPDDVFLLRKSDIIGIPAALLPIIESNTTADELYNLQGQRLTTAPQKGIYIKNGKITITK